MTARFAAMLVLVFVLIVLSLRKPLWGLFGLMIMYYFRPDVWGKPGWFEPVEWLTGVTVISTMVHVRGFRFHPMLMLSLAFLLTMFVSSEAAFMSKEVSYDVTETVAKLIVAQFLVLQLLTGLKELKQFLWMNVIANLWTLKTVMVSGVFGGGYDRVDVGTGQGGGSNYIAMLFVMLLPLLYYRFLHGSRLERKLAMVLAPLCVVAVVVTGSRGGYLTLFAIGALLAIRTRQKAKGFIALVFFGIVFAVATPQEKWDRFIHTFTGEGKETAAENSRIVLWQAAWTMFERAPITGVGHDNYQMLSPRIVGFFAGQSPIPYDPALEGQKGYQGFVAHSIWMQSLADGGLIGSIPFFGLFIAVFVYLRRVRRMQLPPGAREELRDCARILEATFLAFMIGSCFASHMKLDFLWWYFGAVGALDVIARRYRSDMIRAEQIRQMNELAAPRAQPVGAS